MLKLVMIKISRSGLVEAGRFRYPPRSITVMTISRDLKMPPELGIQVDDINKLGPRQRSEKPILLAEDSMLLSRMITESLAMPVETPSLPP